MPLLPLIFFVHYSKDFFDAIALITEIVYLDLNPRIFKALHRIS